MPTESSPAHLGFLTVLLDHGGYLGGYLVTNRWGRPLEFRLSTPIQPNRVQQILYGPTLAGYLSSELIGKTLIEKTGTPVNAILTDCRDALDLRRNVDVPVAWVAEPNHVQPEADATAGTAVRPATSGQGAVWSHPGFPDDVAILKVLFDQIDGMDVTEPFARIREAVGEARKMGITRRD